MTYIEQVHLTLLQRWLPRLPYRLLPETEKELLLNSYSPERTSMNGIPKL